MTALFPRVMNSKQISRQAYTYLFYVSIAWYRIDQIRIKGTIIPSAGMDSVFFLVSSMSVVLQHIVTKVFTRKEFTCVGYEFKNVY